MLHFADDPLFSQRLRVLQLIALALMAGVVAFLVIVLVQAPGQNVPAPFGTLSMIAVFMLAMQLPLAFALPRFLAQVNLPGAATLPKPETPQQEDDLRLADALRLTGRYQVNLLLSFALIESVAFMGLVAYLLEQHLSGLIVAGICLAAMALRFPTRHRVVRWVENLQTRTGEMRRRD